MTVKIDLAPDTYEVEFGDYGVFKVRPLGAGEELQLNAIAREMQEALGSVEQIDTSKKLSKEELDEANAKVKEANASIEKARERIVAIIKRTITSEDPEAVDKLFDELPVVKIREAIGKAINNA